MRFPYKSRPKAVGREIWNKGKKGVMPTPWNKGKKLPYSVWNKGTKGLMPTPWNKGGAEYSLATRLKMSIAKKGKPALLRGEKSNLWKGGITPLYKQIQMSLEWKKWRELIFSRDNWTCVLCKKRGGKLHPDHIKQFAVIIYENKITSLIEARNCKALWNISNGRTLCIPCHMNTDTWGGRTSLQLRKLKQSGELSGSLKR